MTVATTTSAQAYLAQSEPTHENSVLLGVQDLDYTYNATARRSVSTRTDMNTKTCKHGLQKPTSEYKASIDLSLAWSGGDDDSLDIPSWEEFEEIMDEDRLTLEEYYVRVEREASPDETQPAFHLGTILSPIWVNSTRVGHAQVITLLSGTCWCQNTELHPFLDNMFIPKHCSCMDATCWSSSPASSPDTLITSKELCEEELYSKSMKEPWCRGWY
ncbi:uncharacterized protein FIBRA_08300 [Fibroporia radiculosa]|uniref:Uncharacterized protein n=1 Tax=Fibroporia radiculosa TaxID=599839 RepID=J4GH20_9APHY|nr:uncharacterized protein FIBRA_08300 [Fibroporia radiculosa]CCM06053.1 predicted protein [Fibroporia radiculosa]